MNGAYFEEKKNMCLPRASSIFKKISPKTFRLHCVFTRYYPSGAENSFAQTLKLIFSAVRFPN
jgi:hypothetical protein